MADARVLEQETPSVGALKRVLQHASQRAGAVYAVDPREYARSMDEVRGIIGQLAEALEAEDQLRLQRDFGAPQFPATAIQAH